MRKLWQGLLIVVAVHADLVHSVPFQSESTRLLSLSTSPSNLTLSLPPAPPGYDTLSHWDKSLPLDPSAVYVAAVKLMYGLSQRGWSNILDLDASKLGLVEQSGFPVTIYTSSNRPNTLLTTGLMVRALLDTVTTMTTHTPGFYKVTSVLIMHNEPIGQLWITTTSNTPSLTSSSSNNLPISNHTSLPPPTLLNTTLTSHPPTTIPDPLHPLFSIIYQPRGLPLPPLEAYSTILRGLADLARFDRSKPVDWLTPTSLSGKTIFHIVARPQQKLLGWQIARVFWLLMFRVMVKEGGSQELTLRVVSRGVTVAFAFLKKGPVGAGLLESE